jgi:hypothetical protein
MNICCNTRISFVDHAAAQDPCCRFIIGSDTVPGKILMAVAMIDAMSDAYSPHTRSGSESEPEKRRGLLEILVRTWHH